MKLNIFEGARRITKLIAVIWIMGWGYYLMTYEPYITTYFRVDSPTSIPIRMDKAYCGTDDAAENFYEKYTSKGTRYLGELCFKSSVSDDGSKLIPFRMLINLDEVSEEFYKAQLNGDKELALKLAKYLVSKPKEIKRLLFNAKYSSEVTVYTQRVVDAFKLSKADEEWVDGKVWPIRWEGIKESLSSIIGGLAFLYIFSWCIGWIVRGFAGIPSRQDKKSDDI